MNGKIYEPRNDFVLFKIEKQDTLGHLYMPEKSMEGNRRVVVAVGPKVEGLKAGDEVEIIASTGSCGELPGAEKLWITRQDNVALIIKREVVPIEE